MGLVDSIKNAFSSTDNSGEDNKGTVVEGDGEFDEDPFQEDREELEEMLGVEEDNGGENETQEWDTAYQCFDEYIQYQGYSGGNEFLARFMAMKIKGSDKYRDRIRIGKETADMVSSTVESLDDISGSRDGLSGLEDMGNKIAQANKVKQEMEEFTNKDEEAFVGGVVTANRALDVAEKWVNSETDTTSRGSSGGTVKKSDKEI